MNKSLYAILPAREDSVVRKREQNGSWLPSKTNWTVQYRKYGLEGDPQKWRYAYEVLGLKSQMGKRAAEKARKEFMASVNARNRRPSSLMTVTDFWPRFEAEVVWKKKRAGRDHYAYCWRKLEPMIGAMRLTDVDAETVERVIRLSFEQALSGQTVLHLKNCISAMFRLAKRRKLYHEENPAALVELPEIRHKRRPTFSPEQLQLVFENLTSPYLEMALLSFETSMGPAEMLGITLQWCNLTEDIRTVEGVVLAPMSIGVVENYYKGERGSLKESSRERIAPISPGLAGMLRSLVARSPRRDDEAPLFQSKCGTPINSRNVSTRHFAPLAKRLGFPVTWYGFRRAHSTMAGRLSGVSVEDRQRMMGHSSAHMTLYYSIDDVERRRRITEGLSAMWAGPEKGTVN